MKSVLHRILLIGILLIAGCRTSNIASRRVERGQAYENFPRQIQQLVDQGRIQQGMNPDAVYIAWGRPGEVLEEKTRQTRRTIWVYYGSRLTQTRYWEYTPDRYGWGRYDLQRHYYPRKYVAAEVIFEDNRVVDWRRFPKPDSMGY
jgi:hypothetical protein